MNYIFFISLNADIFDQFCHSDFDEIFRNYLKTSHFTFY